MTTSNFSLVYSHNTQEVWAILALLFWQEIPVKQELDYGLCLRLSGGTGQPTLASYDRVLAKGYHEIYTYLNKQGLFQM